MSHERPTIKVRRQKTPRYVHEIPYPNRRAICRIMDGDGSGDWKELAHECGFTTAQINTWSLAFMRPGGSATDSLLTTWSQQMPTIKDLFYILIKIKNILALQSLKDFVDKSMFNHPDIRNYFPQETSEISHNSNDSCEPSDFLPLPPGRNRPVQNSESEDSVGIPAVSSSSSSSCSSQSSSDDGCSIDKKPSRKTQDLENQQKSVLSTLRQYTWKDIQHATKNFDRENLLGKGGFGTVYKGLVKKSLVAIKLLDKVEKMPKDDNLSINKRHFAEIQAALSYQHKNIIQILGYSLDGPLVCLVHQFMENGSLDDRLSLEDGTDPLPWRRRHDILMGAARGLQFLHTADKKKPLIHGDIKSANILLDKHFEAKIGDFGLSRLATSGAYTDYTHASLSDLKSKVFGSEAYLPDDFLRTLKHSISTDTYSFGIVIYEVCLGEKSYDERREGGKLLKEYVESIRLTQDDALIFKMRDRSAPDWPRDAWMPLLQIAHQCAARIKKDRPSMPEVLRSLERLDCKIQHLTTSPPVLRDEESFNLYHTSYPNQFSLTAQHQPPDAAADLPRSLKLVEEMQKLCMEDPEIYASDQKKLALIEEFDRMQDVGSMETTRSTEELKQQCAPFLIQQAYDQRKSADDALKLDSYVPPEELLSSLPTAPVQDYATSNHAEAEQNTCLEGTQEMIAIRIKREKRLPSFD